MDPLALTLARQFSVNLETQKFIIMIKLIIMMIDHPHHHYDHHDDIHFNLQRGRDGQRSVRLLVQRPAC